MRRLALLAASLSSLVSCREPQPSAPPPAASPAADAAQPAPLSVTRAPEAARAPDPPPPPTKRICVDEHNQREVPLPAPAARIALPTQPSLLAQRCAEEAIRKTMGWKGGTLTVRSRLGPGGQVQEACSDDSNLPGDTTLCVLRSFVGNRLRGDQGDVVVTPMSF